MKISFQGPLVDSVVAVVTTTSGTAVPTPAAAGFAIVSKVTVDTNANGAFASAGTSTANSTITITAHGYKTGIVGQVTTSGSLPTGLSTSTNYFVIVVDANTISLATSLANALAGTKTTLTTVGAGNSSYNPTALAGGSVQNQKSLDNVVWQNDGSPTSITASTVVGYDIDRPRHNYYRLQYTLTAGSLTVSSTSVVSKDS